jgi:hypothetical protein
METTSIFLPGRGAPVSQAMDNRKSCSYLPFRPSTGIFIYLSRVLGIEKYILKIL